MAEYLRRIEDHDKSQDRNDLIAKRAYLNKAIMRVNAKLLREGERPNPNLIHDPFENAFVEYDTKSFIGSLHTGHIAEDNLGQQHGFIDNLMRENDGNTKKKKSGFVISTDEIEIKKMQESLMKMSNYDREMFLREGLNNLQVGHHLALTLSVASKLLQKRLEKLRLQCNVAPSPHHAAFFLQQIRPLEIRIKELKERIEALQHGHQTGMAFFLLRPYHPLRILACNIVHRLWFERFMGTIVLGSCITLWVQRPRMAMQEQASLDALNTVFNLLFSVECLLKVMAIYLESNTQSQQI
jgi:hypothetical protein